MINMLCYTLNIVKIGMAQLVECLTAKFWNVAFIPEFGGNNVFLSLGKLNISSLFSAEWLPQNMGFYSPLQGHGYSTVAPLEEK